LAVAASNGFHARTFERKHFSGAARFGLRPIRQLFCTRLQEPYRHAAASLDSRDAPREGQGPPSQYENAACRGRRCLRLRRPRPSHQDIPSCDRRHAGGLAARANHRRSLISYGMTSSIACYGSAADDPSRCRQDQDTPSPNCPTAQSKSSKSCEVCSGSGNAAPTNRTRQRVRRVAAWVDSALGPQFDLRSELFNGGKIAL
jgi:hypothetical protein